MSCVSYDKNFAEALRVRSSSVKKSASLNLAAAYLKLKDYKEVIKNCDKVCMLASEVIVCLSCMHHVFSTNIIVQGLHL